MQHLLSNAPGYKKRQPAWVRPMIPLAQRLLQTEAALWGGYKLVADGQPCAGCTPNIWSRSAEPRQQQSLDSVSGQWPSGKGKLRTQALQQSLKTQAIIQEERGRGFSTYKPPKWLIRTACAGWSWNGALGPMGRGGGGSHRRKVRAIGTLKALTGSS